MNRFQLPVSPGQHAPAVEMTLRREVVEMRYQDRCVAVIDRERLRDWLFQSTSSRLPIDDVTWIGLGGGRVMLSITRAGAWALTPTTVEGLRARL